MRGALLAGLLCCVGCGATPTKPAAPPRPEDAALRTGDKAFEAKQWTRAAAAYDAAMQAGASELRVYARRAELYGRTGDIKEGLRFLVDVIDKRGWHAPELYDQRVELLDLAGDHEAARKLATRVVAMGGRTYLSKRIMCHQKKPKIQYCKEFLAQRPARYAAGDGFPLIAVGLDFLAIDVASLAKEKFEEVIRRFPDDKSLRLNADNGLCAAHTALHETDQAIAACTRVLAQLHGALAAAANFNLAVTYLDAGRVDDARPLAERYATAMNGRGKTAELFDRLARIDHRSFVARNLLARAATPIDSGRAQAALARGDVATAEEMALAHVRAYSWDSEGWRFLARVRARQGRWLECAVAWIFVAVPGMARPFMFTPVAP